MGDVGIRWVAWLREIELQAPHLTARAGEHLNVFRLLEIRRLRLEQAPHCIDLPGLQLQDGCVSRRDEAKHDAVQDRPILVPIRHVALEGEMIAGREFGYAKRPGTKWLPPVVRLAYIPRSFQH